MTETPIIEYELLREGIKQNNIRIIDVRREDDYTVGHIKNSVNLPLAKLTIFLLIMLGQGIFQ